MKKLNVWILTSEFPPMFGGGISTYCWEAGVAWSSLGHEVKVFTRAGENHKDSVTEQLRVGLSVVRVPIIEQPMILQSLGYWHLMAYCLANKVIDEIRKTGVKPDLIEVQEYGALAYFLIKKKLAGAVELIDTKIVLYLHTPVFELSKINQESSYSFPNYWIGQCEKFCILAADAVLSPSIFLKERIQDQVQREINVITYPYFGESDERIEALCKIQPEYDCVYLGRLEYRKGVLHLLSAFKKIWDSGKNIRLRLVGGDTQWVPKQVSMKEYIETKYCVYISSGLLTISPPVPPEQMPSAFASGKITVVPSIYENFPYVCIQSMDLARPTLVSITGGQAEMIGGFECGGVFDWSNAESFETQLLTLLNKTDKDLLQIGKNSRKRIHKICSYENVILKRIEHFNTISSKTNRVYPFVGDDRSCLSGLNIGSPNKIKNKGKLSIVIPFFNLGEFLPETLESINNSDYSNKEIVIVNDGSDDVFSLELLRKIKVENNGITVIDIENAGLANARNVGARSATGEFIAFLDADDCIDTSYFSKCVSFLNNYDNVSFVYSWVKYFGEADGLWINFDTELPYMLGANMLAAFQVVRRNDFIDYGINDSEMMFGMEDYEAWLRMVKNGKRGVSIPEPLVSYRVRPNSMARQFKRNTVLFMYEQIVVKNRDVYEKFGAEIFMLLNANGPGYLWNNPTLNYPQIGHVNPLASNRAINDNYTKYEIDDLTRIKYIISNPSYFIKVLKVAISLKFNKWFK